MDDLELMNLMSRAYLAHQVGGSPSAAVGLVRARLADDSNVRERLSGHLGDLAHLIAARSVGATCGDHISKVQHDILAAALNEAP